MQSLLRGKLQTKAGSLLRPVQSTAQQNPVVQNPRQMDFGDYSGVYGGQSSWSILRSLAILRLCRIPVLINRGEDLFQRARAVFGDHLTTAVIRNTFFAHFCAGENSAGAVESARYLLRHGVGGMFDCGAETPSRCIPPDELKFIIQTNLKDIMESIEAAGLPMSAGRIAVKPTTLANLDSLERMTSFLQIIKQSGSFPHKESFQQTFEACMDLYRNQKSTHHQQIEQDVEEMEELKRRLEAIAEACCRHGVRLMLDAEESDFQSAVHLIALTVMEAYNESQAWVWNTYQCYLRDTKNCLIHDLDQMVLRGRFFGVKLVRGAYMKHESIRSVDLHQESPLFTEKFQTDEAYNEAAEMLLRRMHEGDRIEMCLATHNQASIQQAVDFMHQKKMKQSEVPVYFAQLNGMSDYLTYTLAQHQYKSLKLLVYGKIPNVMGYLIRRAQENGDVLGGGHKDIKAMTIFLFRRWNPLRSITYH